MFLLSFFSVSALANSHTAQVAGCRLHLATCAVSATKERLTEDREHATDCKGQFPTCVISSYCISKYIHVRLGHISHLQPLVWGWLQGIGFSH